MSDALRAGTTDGDDRDAAQAEAGTSTSADGNAAQALAEAQAEIERLKAVQAQGLAEKDTLENLKREVAELRSRSASPPNGGGAGVHDTRVGLPAVMQARLRQHAAAFEADPENAQDSALVVGLAQMLQAQNYQMNELRGLIEISPEQKKVADLQREYASRGESISPATARLLLGVADTSADATTKQRRAERQQDDDERTASTKVGTRTVGVSASDLPQKTMTMGEWERRVERMTPAEQRAFDAKLVSDGTVVLPE